MKTVLRSMAVLIMTSIVAVAHANPPNNCQGDACGVVDIGFDPNTGAYNARNLSGRHVKVTISNGMITPELHLAPGQQLEFGWLRSMYMHSTASFE